MKRHKGKAVKARDEAIGSVGEQSCQVKKLEAHMGLLKDKLDSPKWKQSTGCNVGIVSYMVADA